MKRYIVKLSEEEKKHLHALTHKGTCSVRKLRRVQMLREAQKAQRQHRLEIAISSY